MLTGSSRGIARVAFGIVASLLLAALALVPVLGSREDVERRTTFRGSYPEVGWAQLAAKADAIAEVVVEGSPTVHWNSSDGKEWTARAETDRAYIYTDWTLRVEVVHKGDMKPGPIELRLPGGLVNGVEMVFEDSPVLESGDRFLALLDLRPTPTQFGTQERWVVHWQHLGVSRADGPGRWRNDALGIVVTEADVKEAAIGE